MTQLGPGGEFEAIRELMSGFGDAAQGIGDDAAMLRIPSGEQAIVSVDACVEGRHFRREWLPAKGVGYRAVTAALSDLAAMAATPHAVLLAINLPVSWREELFELGQGAASAVLDAEATIVGGNISGAEEFSITTTVVGSARRPLERRSARVGDRLYVTGKLGGPGEAVRQLSGGHMPAGPIYARFALPEARILEAQWLAAHGASAAIDISDGVIADAAHIAAASGVGLIIHLERLPLMEGSTPLRAAASGEEYELLVAAPAIDTAAFHFPCGIAAVGEVVPGSGVTTLLEGRRVDPPRGHDHLSS